MTLSRNNYFKEFESVIDKCKMHTYYYNIWQGNKGKRNRKKYKSCNGNLTQNYLYLSDFTNLKIMRLNPLNYASFICRIGPLENASYFCRPIEIFSLFLPAWPGPFVNSPLFYRAGYRSQDRPGPFPRIFSLSNNKLNLFDERTRAKYIQIIAIWMECLQFFAHYFDGKF